MGDLDRIIVLYPILYSVPPMIFREFVETHKDLFENKEIICLVSQMIVSGDGARVIEDYLPESASLIDSHHVNMPNNISQIPMIPVSTGAGNRRKTRKALRKAERIARSIREENFKRRHCSKLAKLIGLSQRPAGLKSEGRKRANVWVSDDCIKCGLCVKICPTKNFELGQDKAQPQGR